MRHLRAVTLRVVRGRSFRIFFFLRPGTNTMALPSCASSLDSDLAAQQSQAERGQVLCVQECSHDWFACFAEPGCVAIVIGLTRFYASNCIEWERAHARQPGR